MAYHDMGSATKLVAITKSNSTVYTEAIRAIWVGGTGNVAVVAPDDYHAGNVAGVVLVAVPDGTLLPVAAAMILETGTSATNLVGLI